MKMKWKPSIIKNREYAQKMDEIDEFVSKRNINASADNNSYYFKINGISYRVSNHTIAASNAGAYNFLGEKVREKYHTGDEKVVEIFASKTRIIDIYNSLEEGKKLDGRGNII